LVDDFLPSLDKANDLGVAESLQFKLVHRPFPQFTLNFLHFLGLEADGGYLALVDQWHYDDVFTRHAEVIHSCLERISAYFISLAVEMVDISLAVHLSLKEENVGEIVGDFELQDHLKVASERQDVG
jgi:hypothetical protein